MSAFILKETPSEAQCCWTDVTAPLPAGFALESGEFLSKPYLRLRVHGDLRQPALAVAGGISAGRAIADTQTEKGWWRDVAGSGRSLDPETFCIVSFDFLPNDGETARRITTLDQARALDAALDHLGVERLHAFVGASYGGMAALSFAAAFPSRIQCLVSLCAAEKPHPFGTALRGVQRRIIEFAIESGRAGEGVSLARQLAMASYRSPKEFESRFAADNRLQGETSEVCDYLTARGSVYQMNPQRYLTLSHSIDSHWVELDRIAAPTLFIAAQGDQLAPPSDIRRCASAVARARYVEIASSYGHDAFLKESAAIGPFIQKFLTENLK
ncbi:MAG: homoserine O-succinyltransferase [Pseudomonadota bacterium]